MDKHTTLKMGRIQSHFDKTFFELIPRFLWNSIINY